MAGYRKDRQHGMPRAGFLKIGTCQGRHDTPLQVLACPRPVPGRAVTAASLGKSCSASPVAAGGGLTSLVGSVTWDSPSVAAFRSFPPDGSNGYFKSSGWISVSPTAPLSGGVGEAVGPPARPAPVLRSTDPFGLRFETILETQPTSISARFQIRTRSPSAWCGKPLEITHSLHFPGPGSGVEPVPWASDFPHALRGGRAAE